MNQDIIRLAVKAGVIDSADINRVHISPEYMADLARFADLVQQVERAEISKALQLYHANLVEVGNQYGPDVVLAAINMIEDLRK